LVGLAVKMSKRVLLFVPAAFNRACLVRKGFAIRVVEAKNPSKRVQQAIQRLLYDREAQKKAESFSRVMAQWDGPKLAAQLLYEKLGMEQ